MEDARKLRERNWRNVARNRDSWQKLLKKPWLKRVCCANDDDDDDDDDGDHDDDNESIGHSSEYTVNSLCLYNQLFALFHYVFKFLAT